MPAPIIMPRNVIDMNTAACASVEKPSAFSAAITPPARYTSNASRNAPALISPRIRQWNREMGRRSSLAPALTAMVLAMGLPLKGMAMRRGVLVEALAAHAGDVRPPRAAG